MDDPSGDVRRFRFSADRRIKRSRDFKRVREEGRTVRGGLLMLGMLAVGGKAAFKTGLVTSRRVGGAVARNRVRRRLREIVRRHQHEVAPGWWLVVIARPGAGEASSAMLEKEWLRLMQRGRLIADS